MDGQSTSFALEDDFLSQSLYRFVKVNVFGANILLLEDVVLRMRRKGIRRLLFKSTGIRFTKPPKTGKK